MNLRVGTGYDVHKLQDAVPFVIGGISIEHTKGAIGHSDADVLIHAICDALLGAANLGDIGLHFPDTDASYKAIDSKILLSKVDNLLAAQNYRIINVDSTISLQHPKLRPYIPQMQTVLADVLNIDIMQISIKATTTEKLGFEGREEGVSARAIVLIEKID